MTIIGTCSICGGAVVLPEPSERPVAVCEGCGAIRKYSHGPMIPMQPAPDSWRRNHLTYIDGFGHDWSKY